MEVLERHCVCYFFLLFVYTFVGMSERKSNPQMKIHMHAFLQLASHEEWN